MSAPFKADRELGATLLRLQDLLERSYAEQLYQSSQSSHLISLVRRVMEASERISLGMDRLTNDLGSIADQLKAAAANADAATQAKLGPLADRLDQIVTQADSIAGVAKSASASGGSGTQGLGGSPDAGAGPLRSAPQSMTSTGGAGSTGRDHSSASGHFGADAAPSTAAQQKPPSSSSSGD